MNDEIEHLPGTRHRATQTGCRHWAPIAPLLADEKDRSKERLVMPQLGEFTVAHVEPPGPE
ncbi:MAG: hypothetical protein H6R16_1613 [Proteobacteria bacterium]|nr:hypothetical protein [Pseudomonadota bacterium]